MKVNPTGVQAYQQILKPDGGDSRPNVRSGQAHADAQKISIEPQSAVAGSAAAVSAQSPFAARLTESEQTALELLFAKYQERIGNGGSYGTQTSGEVSRSGLGLLVDLKG